MLEEMIDWMLNLVSGCVNEEEEKQLFNRLPISEPLRESVRLYFSEINNLSNPVHNVTIDDPKVLKAAKDLENELMFLKQCQITHFASSEEKNNEFRSRISSERRLMKLLEIWLDYDFSVPIKREKNPLYSDDLCLKLLRRNSKRKDTESRVLNWMKTHEKEVFEIVMMDVEIIAPDDLRNEFRAACQDTAEVYKRNNS